MGVEERGPNETGSGYGAAGAKGWRPEDEGRGTGVTETGLQ
jgi:hypothetical protein